MNENLKKLVEEATTVEHGVIQPRNIGTVYHFDKEKFAKSIVRECIHIALKDALPEYDTAFTEANTQCVKIAAELRQHFGVEW